MTHIYWPVKKLAKYVQRKFLPGAIFPVNSMTIAGVFILWLAAMGK